MIQLFLFRVGLTRTVSVSILPFHIDVCLLGHCAVPLSSDSTSSSTTSDQGFADNSGAENLSSLVTTLRVYRRRSLLIFA